MGLKAKFNRTTSTKPEFFGFVEDEFEDFEEVVPGIYNDDHRERMLDNGEINAEEYGFMLGWEDAWDEPSAE